MNLGVKHILEEYKAYRGGRRLLKNFAKNIATVATGINSASKIESFQVNTN